MELNRLRRPSRKIYFAFVRKFPSRTWTWQCFFWLSSSSCRTLLRLGTEERECNSTFYSFVHWRHSRYIFGRKPYGEDELLGIVRRVLFAWLESLSDWRKINNFCCISCCTPLCFTFWWLLLSAAFLGPSSGREKRGERLPQNFYISTACMIRIADNWRKQRGNTFE